MTMLRQLSLSIRTEIYAVFTVLTVVSFASFGLTYWRTQESQETNQSRDLAAAGTIHLERINGLIYEVVMESRGIYMSASSEKAEPFARGLEKALNALREEIGGWKSDLLSSERARVANLETHLMEFIKFRTELVRLGRVEGPPKARVYGDDEIVRVNRETLNRQVQELAESYRRLSQESAEAVAASDRSNIKTLVILAAVTAIAVIAGFLAVNRGLIGPLYRLMTVMHRLADGISSVDVPGTQKNDEMGELARTVRVLRDNAVERERLRADIAAVAARRETNAQKLERIIDRFRDVIGEVTKGVQAEATGMRGTANSLTSVAADTASRADLASAASQNATRSVQTVAASTEALGASIREISAQTNKVNTIAEQASTSVSRTNDQVGGLAQAARRIGDVVDMIRSIADQTNLLALNATIEAARAGDAGKGFAIVAQEVKTLSAQTAKATEEIAAQIASVQAATGTAVGAIGSITSTISEIKDLTATIAAAIEEQNTATLEISRNIVQTAKDSAEVALNVEGVSGATAETRHAAEQVQETAHVMISVAERLSTTVEGFLSEVGSEMSGRNAA